MASSLDGSSFSGPGSIALSGKKVLALDSLTKVIMMKNMKCVMLEKHNYFRWKAKFSALLWGYRLMDYVEEKVDLSSDSTSEQQDQLTLSWILTSVSPSLLPHFMVLSTSVEVWQCLKSQSDLCI